MKEIHIRDLQQISDIKQYLESCIDGETFHVRFIFGSSFQNAKILRDVLDTTCTLMWLEAKWKTRMVLIVDELNNNAVEYGSREADENTLEVYMSKNNSGIQIKISVEDSGKGEKSKTAEQMEELREERLSKGFKNHHSIRGRGLFMIITNLVDTLYFKNSERSGLIVWIEKKL